MAFVLALALVQTEQAMTLAEKQEDGIDYLTPDHSLADSRSKVQKATIFKKVWRKDRIFALDNIWAFALFQSPTILLPRGGLGDGTAF